MASGTTGEADVLPGVKLPAVVLSSVQSMGKAGTTLALILLGASFRFQNLISVFEKMHEAIHGSILIISHQERILETADKIVVLVDGEIRAIGSKDEIMPVLMQASSVCSRLADKV